MKKKTIILTLLCLCIVLLSCGKTTEPLDDPAILVLLGDVNKNGRNYEISDVVMLTNYHVVGIDAFEDHVEYSTMASDVNMNGIPLELADISYMIGVIQGEIDPAVPSASSNSVCEIVTEFLNMDNCTSTLFNCQEEISVIKLQYRLNGGIGRVFKGVATNDMELQTNIEGNTLTIFIYSFDTGVDGSYGNQISVFEGWGELISAEIASREGVNIPVVIQ